MNHVFKVEDCFSHDILTVAKESYEANGYCVVDNVYPSTELDVMEAFFEDFKTQGHKAFGNYIGTDDDLADNHVVDLTILTPQKNSFVLCILTVLVRRLSNGISIPGSHRY